MDDNGDWEAKLQTPDPGAWHFVARYNGDKDHTPALSSLCTTAVS